MQLDSAGVALAGFFLVMMCLIAYIAFRLVRRTVKIAFKMTVMVIILLIAVIGSVSLWYFMSGSTSSPRSPSGRTR
ncbi:MAG: hypothetical protein LC734_02090 [Acidobacteria bacterium]|nr:hypothetical protein [Acidobacteriota bacterium]